MRRVGRGELLWTLPAVLPFAAAVAMLAVPRELTRLVLGYLLGSIATMGMVVSAIVIWRRATGTGRRWFWAGAAVWTVGVLLKFVAAGIWYEPGLAAAKQVLPHPTYLLVGSLYGGLFTGVFEGGVTLLAGLKWRSLARDGNRAVAVGIGAGVTEALFIGLPVFVVMVANTASFGTWTAADRAEGLVSLRDPLSAAVWLMLPVERTYALLVHTEFRVLVLLTVATGRWRYFWCSFLLFTAIDSGAAYFDLTGQVETISTWWIELALAPFGLVSVPIIVWCLRRWPVAGDTA